MRIRSAIAVTGILITGAMLTACGSRYDQTHNHNTPVGPYEAPTNAVIELPYNWNNIVRVCDKGEGIYEAFGGTAVYVVPNDPNCK